MSLRLIGTISRMVQESPAGEYHKQVPYSERKMVTTASLGAIAPLTGHIRSEFLKTRIL